MEEQLIERMLKSGRPIRPPEIPSRRESYPEITRLLENSKQNKLKFEEKISQLEQQILNFEKEKQKKIMNQVIENKQQKSFNALLKNQRTILENIAKSKLNTIQNDSEKKIFEAKFKTKTTLELNRLRKEFLLNSTSSNSAKGNKLKQNIIGIKRQVNEINREYGNFIRKTKSQEASLKKINFQILKENGSLQEVNAEENAMKLYIQKLLNGTNNINEKKSYLDLKMNLDKFYKVKKRLFDPSFSPEEKQQIKQQLQNYTAVQQKLNSIKKNYNKLMLTYQEKTRQSEKAQKQYNNFLKESAKKLNNINNIGDFNKEENLLKQNKITKAKKLQKKRFEMFSALRNKYKFVDPFSKFIPIYNKFKPFFINYNKTFEETLMIMKLMNMLICCKNATNCLMKIKNFLNLISCIFIIFLRSQLNGILNCNRI